MSPPYEANVIDAASSLVNAVVAPDEKRIVTIGACHTTSAAAAKAGVRPFL